MQGEHDSSNIEPPPGYRSAKDSRSKRRVGRNGGTWKGDKKIGTFTFDTVTWTRKRLSYQNPNSKKNDGCSCIMHEYSLDESLLPNPSNYVLCLLRKEVTERTDGTNVSHNHNAIEKSQRCDRPFSLEEHHQDKRLKLDLAQPHQLICNYNQQTEAIPATGGMSAFAQTENQDNAKDLIAFCSTSSDDASAQDKWITELYQLLGMDSTEGFQI
ncbi:hypothetical protein Peur_073933 [Populus x canadensis]